MTVNPRDNSSNAEEVEKSRVELGEKGWKNISSVWDKDLKVWRVSGTWREQTCEGRGSTELLALSNLHIITPKNA